MQKYFVFPTSIYEVIMSHILKKFRLFWTDRMQPNNYDAKRLLFRKLFIPCALPAFQSHALP
jgi:hypothetical protein